MTKKRYTLHPACKLFPPLPKEQLQELADDIKEKGLLQPITLHENKILDGRNRYQACKLAGVKPRFIKWDGKGSVLEWVISSNLMRRHLSASQKATIAFDLLPMLEKEAKERQRQSKGRGIKGREKFSTLNGRASECAARITKSNHKYVEIVKKLDEKAPDLIPKIRSGVLKIADAQRLADLSPAERKRALSQIDGEQLSSAEVRELAKDVRQQTQIRAAKRFAKTIKTNRTQNIHVADMDVLWDKLKDKSVDLFLTDPPYADLESYERLTELAAAKLKPGKLCLAYSGQLHLHKIMELMGKHLTYWWTFAIEFSGSHCAIHPRKIQNSWKPILAFAKPPVKPASSWLSDHLEGGGRDKKYHEWGQDQNEIEYLIEHLTRPGSLIVDPFCGGGTLPVACKLMGRKWMATEVDKATALIARKRVAEVGR